METRPKRGKVSKEKGLGRFAPVPLTRLPFFLFHGTGQPSGRFCEEASQGKKSAHTWIINYLVRIIGEKERLSRRTPLVVNETIPRTFFFRCDFRLNCFLCEKMTISSTSLGVNATHSSPSFRPTDATLSLSLSLQCVSGTF